MRASTEPHETLSRSLTSRSTICAFKPLHRIQNTTSQQIIGVMENNADHKEKGNEGEEKKDSVIPEFSIEYKRDV